MRKEQEERNKTKRDRHSWEVYREELKEKDDEKKEEVHESGRNERAIVSRKSCWGEKNIRTVLQWGEEKWREKRKVENRGKFELLLSDKRAGLLSRTEAALSREVLIAHFGCGCTIFHIVQLSTLNLTHCRFSSVKSIGVKMDRFHFFVSKLKNYFQRH